MKYLFSDYLFLRFAAAKDAHTAGDAYRGMAAYLGCALTGDTVACAAARLSADGLITLPDGCEALTPDTPITMTDAGRKWVEVTGLQKLLRRTERVLATHMAAFTAREMPAEAPSLRADTAAFAPLVHESFPFILPALSEDGETVSLTVKDPDGGIPTEGAEDENDSDFAESLKALMVCEPITSAGNMREWLIAVTALATEASRTRKLALHGADRSYVVTLAPQAGQIRVTVAPIRFNRQRFRGKRNGDLDYAQCGENVMDFTVPVGTLAWGTACGAVCLPTLLDDETCALVGRLYNTI